MNRLCHEGEGSIELWYANFATSTDTSWEGEEERRKGQLAEDAHGVT